MGVAGPLETGSIAQDGGMPTAVRELAADLLHDAPQISREITDRLFVVIPELADTKDAELWEETRASTEANVDQALRLLKLGASADALVVPLDAAEFVRGLVRRGLTLPVLLRTYRVGHAAFWERWSAALLERVEDSSDLVAAREASSAFLFAYIDRISDILVSEYGSERERLVRSAEQMRAETVRTILARKPIDEEVAASRLGYELRCHHIALRVNAAGGELRGLERAALAAASALGPTKPLVVPAGVATLDVWCGSLEAPDASKVAALQDHVPPDGIRITFGSPGHGSSGFRESHNEAVQAGRVVALAGGLSAPVTSYRAVELVSLLTADLPRARAFVAARLGPLAANAEPAERLRETVRAFLAANRSSTRVAKELYVHQNTVAYRVKRAEELLGRSVTDDQAELMCALTLAAVLGPAVLTGADDGVIDAS
jgi:DNA-binding PucR family transcriptional regulator